MTEGFDPTNYDVFMAACRPVTLSATEKRFLRANPDIDMPPVYPGSIVKKCRACGRDVFVGPKIQEQMEQRRVEIWCFTDAAQLQAVRGQFGVSTAVHELGNQFKPKKE